MEITANHITPSINRLSDRELLLNKLAKENGQLLQKNQDGLNSSEDKTISQDQIVKKVAQENKSFALHNTRLEFSIHEKTKEVMVKVVDEGTGELIREIPPEKALDMLAMVWGELGLLVDEKV